MKKENENKADAHTKLQWHPAFFAGLQIEFQEEMENLIFENEHQLGTRPKEIDVLIIKKKPEVEIHKNIGRIFRVYNIIEYKSPTDYISIDDFYKVYGYACFYKSDSGSTNSIAMEDVTITFACLNYPGKLLKQLQIERNIQVSKQEEGIYYLKGDSIPIQMLVTSQLSERENLWLRGLTNRLQDSTITEKLAIEYQKNKNNELYISMMDIIIKANRKKFEEESTMCKAIIELFQDEYDEGIRKNTEQVTKHTLMATLFDFLQELGEISEKTREEVEQIENPETLRLWIKIAASSNSIEDFQKKIVK